MCWHRNGCLQQEQLSVRDWRGDDAQRWLGISARPSASHLLDLTFLDCKRREQRACCLPGFFHNRALNLCHQQLNSLVYCRMTCKETKFIFLSVNSDTPLGCVNFYSMSLELWMAAPVFTVGIGDKLCTSLHSLSLLLQDGLSTEADAGVSWS